MVADQIGADSVPERHPLVGAILEGRCEHGLVRPVEGQWLARVRIEREPYPPHRLEHLVADRADRGLVGSGEQASAAPHGDLLGTA